MQKQKRKHGDARPDGIAIVGRMIWQGLSGGAKGIWQLIQMIASGIRWLISHSVSGAIYLIKQIAKGGWQGVQYLAAAAWWLLKQPYRFGHYLLNGHVPEFETKREREIFWRIKRRYRRRKLLFVNVLLFGVWLFFAGTSLFNSYAYWQRAIANNWQNPGPEYYANFFYNDVRWLSLYTGIFVIILIAHVIFNKMSNNEDEVIAEALDAEYARSDNRPVAIPDIQRLEDPSYTDEYDYHDDMKPKRNGASL